MHALEPVEQACGPVPNSLSPSLVRVPSRPVPSRSPPQASIDTRGANARRPGVGRPSVTAALLRRAMSIERREAAGCGGEDLPGEAAGAALEQRRAGWIVCARRSCRFSSAAMRRASVWSRQTMPTLLPADSLPRAASATARASMSGLGAAMMLTPASAGQGRRQMRSRIGAPGGRHRRRCASAPRRTIGACVHRRRAHRPRRCRR